MKWVMFDGPVDALWIENMNTVLDDNMTLCLSNGERIRLKPEMRMIFECDDLSNASPATVSRCGMVYSAPETCHWTLIAYTWIERLPDVDYTPKAKEMIKDLFDTNIDMLFETFEKYQFKQPITTCYNNLVESLCRMWNLSARAANGFLIESMEGEVLKRSLNRIFIFSLAWGFGGSIDEQCHSRFETFLSTQFSLNDLPKGSIFDYRICFKDGDYATF